MKVEEESSNDLLPTWSRSSAGETPPMNGVRESRRVRRKPVKYADWVNDEENSSDDSEWSFDGNEVNVFDDRAHSKHNNFKINMQPLSIGLLNFYGNIIN